MQKRKRTNSSNLRTVYSRLFRISEDTFASREYDVAYHALSGALHCAASLKDTKYLKEVERLAGDQLKWIDTHAPEYEHSTQSSSKRGLPSIYKNLATMANAKAVILQHEAKKG